MATEAPGNAGDPSAGAHGRDAGLDPAPPPRRQRKQRTVPGGQPMSARSYAVLALVTGLVGIALLVFYVWKVPMLVASGIQSQVFYLLLFPWALACAAFLFGAMRSYAVIRHKQLGNALVLGGPVVLFALVVWGGFRLVPPAAGFFDLTVRAHGADGDAPMITSGGVIVELGRERRRAAFDASGEANFKGVAAAFRGKPVRMLPQVVGYREAWQQATISDDVLDLALALAPRPRLRLTGVIEPPPIDPRQLKVTVHGQDTVAVPDELGRFALLVDGKPGERVRLKVYRGTQRVYDDFQLLPGPVTLAVPAP